MLDFIKLYTALITTVFFWSSAFVGIRIGLESYTPGALALLRFLVASSVMLIFYIFKVNIHRTTLKEKLYLMFLGIISVTIYHVCLNAGEVYISAGEAGFIVGLMPVITVILSIIFFKEKLNMKVLCGVFISITGLFLMAYFENKHTNNLYAYRAFFLVFIAALMGAIYTVLQKAFIKEHNAMTVSVWVIWGGTIGLLFFTKELIGDFTHASLYANLAAVYLGVFPAAIANVTWAYSLIKLKATTASIYLYTMPIISTLLGIVILKEIPSTVSFIGGLVSLVGAFIAVYFEEK